MKKIAFASLALCAFALASCSSEDTPVTNDGSVSFTAQLPSIGSRAFADGTTAGTLFYYVYDAEAAQGTAPIISSTTTFDPSTLSAQVNLSLVTGKTYDIVFWAASADASCYTYSETDKSVTVTYDGDANDESRDAFFNTVLGLEVKGAINRQVVLNRPFAQVNFGTSDLEESKAAGFELTTTGLKMILPNTLDLMTGAVSGASDVAVSFNQTAIPTSEVFPVEPETYDYISMNYILADAEKSIVDLALTTDHPNRAEIAFNSVPVQRNFRTNIYGALLTNPANFEVIIDKEFNTPDLSNVVTSEAELVEAITSGANAEIPAGASITLTEPIELADNQTLTVNGTLASDKNVITIPAGVSAAIKGNGKIDFTFAGDGIAEGGTWVTNGIDIFGNLTIEDVTFETENHLAGSMIYAWENSEVELNNVVVNTGYRALTTAPGAKVVVNGGEYNSTSHNGYQASNGNSRYAYAIVITGDGAEAELNGVKITGIQGGFSVSRNSKAVLNDCNVIVKDPEVANGPGRSFYAVYTAQGADVTINSGKYFAMRYATYSGDNDITGDAFGSMSLKGGSYSQKPTWSQADKKEYPLPEGYKWEATGNVDYPWKVVAE